MNYEQFVSLAQNFLDHCFTELKNKHFTLENHWHIDHLCFRTESNQRYEELKQEFSHFSTLLIESEVNGRLISTFKLSTPLTYEGFDIDLLELPAPKKVKVVKEGFEHFEIVSDLSFQELKDRFKNITIDESGTKKLFNKELEFCFDGFAVKFHHQSLESVINLENNHTVDNILKETQILKILEDLNPLVVNTFLLGIAQESSDLDILVQYDKNEEYKNFMTLHLKHLPNFKIEQFETRHQTSILASFDFKGLSFEIFAQEIPATKQVAYRHFLIEERLLKLGGPLLKEKILTLRKEGLKTEPAFAKALNLSGDPFEELLKLQTYSNNDLKFLFKD